MKNLLLLWSCLLMGDLYAQSGIAKSLEPGNRWVYASSEYGRPGRRITQEFITHDTTFSGRVYAILQDGPQYRGFERADSARIYHYSIFSAAEIVACNFNAKVGDVFGGYRVTYAYSKLFWGKTKKFIHYYSASQTSWSAIVYAEGIGMISSSGDSHGAPEYSTILGAAFLNGVAYGETTLLAVDKPFQNAVPSTVHLYPNYPNPFNPTTTIRYSLPSAQEVTLKIYNLHGHEILTLVNAKQEVGEHNVNFDASQFASGVYFYKLTAGRFSEIKKMLLVR